MIKRTVVCLLLSAGSALAKPPTELLALALTKRFVALDEIETLYVQANGVICHRLKCALWKRLLLLIDNVNSEFESPEFDNRMMRLMKSVSGLDRARVEKALTNFATHLFHEPFADAVLDLLDLTHGELMVLEILLERNEINTASILLMSFAKDPDAMLGLLEFVQSVEMCG